jgi:hypothetical protein
MYISMDQLIDHPTSTLSRFVSYRRLSPQLQYSLSAAALEMYISMDQLIDHPTSTLSRFVSYRRLSPQLQYSLSAAALEMYLYGSADRSSYLYTLLIVSYLRLLPKFKFSLSATALEMYLYGSADRSSYLYIKCVVAQPGGVSLVPTDEKLVQLRLGEKTKIISLASDRQEQKRRNKQCQT